MRKHRANWNESQKERNREKSKIRMRKLRERQKLKINNPETLHRSIITRHEIKKQDGKRLKQKLYKRTWREGLAAQKKRRIREKDAAQKRKKRAPRAKVVINIDKVKVNDAPTSSTGKPMTTYAIIKAVQQNLRFRKHLNDMQKL